MCSGRESKPSRAENERRLPLEPVQSWMNDGLSVALLFETAANARSQFRRCTSTRRFLAACSGVLAFGVYTAEPDTIPTVPRACPAPNSASTMSTAVATTRMIGKINFIGSLRPRNAVLDARHERGFPQRPALCAARGAGVQGKSPGNLYQSVISPTSAPATAQGLRRTPPYGRVARHPSTTR